MSKTGSEESKLSWYLKATVLGCPTGHVNTLPRSYSLGSTRSGYGDGDFMELLRDASTRHLDDEKARLDRARRQQARQSPKMPRSQSVGIGRIDEDKPCDFEEDVIKVKPAYFPRRSCAITKRKGGL